MKRRNYIFKSFGLILFLSTLFLTSEAPALDCPEGALKDSFKNSEGDTETVCLRQSKKVGRYQKVNPNGVTIVDGQYSDGKMIGTWRRYYPNGSLKDLGNWIEDYPDGKWEAYYENGQKRSSGSFQRGVKAGWWFSYEPDGNLIAAENYDQTRFQLNGYFWAGFRNSGTLYTGTLELTFNFNVPIDWIEPMIGVAAIMAKDSVGTFKPSLRLSLYPEFQIDDSMRVAPIVEFLWWGFDVSELGYGARFRFFKKILFGLKTTASSIYQVELGWVGFEF